MPIQLFCVVVTKNGEGLRLGTLSELHTVEARELFLDKLSQLGFGREQFSPCSGVTSAAANAGVPDSSE